MVLAPQDASGGYCPQVTVIVPAYNAAETLPACLAALATQDYPRSAYEVIVVDDGSTDETAAIAHKCNVSVITQPNAGPAAARNRGAAAAQGDLLLFTDADCVPVPGWISALVAPFSDPSVAGAKGRLSDAPARHRPSLHPTRISRAL